MHKNLWVIVIGYSGSGKTTISEILRQKGIMSFEFSDYFQTILNLQETTRQEMFKNVKDYIRTKGRKAFISDIISWIEREISPTYHGPVFLIGARNGEDIKILKSLRYVAFCVLVHTSEKKRIDRIVKRCRVIDRNIINSMINKDEIEENPDLTNCIEEYTDYVIENNGEITDLINQINSLLNTLRICYEPKRTSKTAI